MPTAALVLQEIVTSWNKFSEPYLKRPELVCNVMFSDFLQATYQVCNKSLMDFPISF